MSESEWVTARPDLGKRSFGAFMDGLPPTWTPEEGLRGIELALLGDGAQRQIAEMGVQVIAMLLGKNKRYGNAALDPIKVFAKGLTAADKIRIRLDDKISRLYRGEDHTDGERVEVDMIGYLILLLIAEYEAEHEEGIA